MVAETTTSKDDDAVVISKTKKEKNQLTKRQRRKQPNEKHKWPQHPKIQSMDVRQKAYIRVAGLGSSSTTKTKKEMIDPKLDLMSPEVKFGRLLGGTDQRKRHAAVTKLKQYLKARCDVNNENGGISEMDLLKLWKGLWHTLFMADKVAVQDELSKRLAELLWCVAGTEEEDEYAGQAYMEMCEAEEQGQGGEDDDEDEDDDDVIMEEIENTLGKGNDDDDDDEDDSSSKESGSDDGDDDEEEDEEGDDQEHEHGGPDCDHEDMVEEIDESEIPHCRGAHLASLFIRCFFRTVRREWGNMDKYRVDKFYTLIRLYMHEIFKYMASRHWNLGIIRLFNDAMFEEILSKTPNGLRYHLIDVALEELAKVNSTAPMPLTEATFLDTLEPYFAMCQTGGGDDIVQGRVMENVIEKFLLEYSFVSDRAVEERESGEQEKSLVFDQVHVESVAQFIFELASDPETKDQYRKSIYDMHKAFARRLKKVGTDVELLADEEGDEDDTQDYDGDEIEMDNGEEENEQGAEEDAEVEPVEEEVEEEKVDHKKKRKRKATKEAKEEEPIEAKKREKKKSKRKKESKSEADSETQLLNPTANAEDDDEEEEVTISLSEQKQAETKRKKGKKKKKAQEQEEKKAKEEAESNADRKERRVQWERVNKSKSYKASMKALITREIPKTAKASPEKGILLNKGKVKVIKGGKKNRKRAVNYF